MTFTIDANPVISKILWLLGGRMTVLVIENYPDTPLGLVGEALKDAEIGTRIVAAHAGETVPGSAGDWSGLVVLGGEQNALDDAGFPFLPDVCTLIRAFHDAGKPVLGICLGAQLIVRAFGGRNILGQPVEFGWHQVAPTEEGSSDPVLKELGSGAKVFHWHTDTFELPADAIHLATSKQTHHQAFRLGATTYSIQFHFEASQAVVRDWSEKFAASVEQYDPDWPNRLDAECARNGPEADRTGLNLARAWVRLLKAE